MGKSYLNVISRGSRKEIMALIEETSFNQEEEIALVKRGMHEAIMEYLNRYGALEDKAEEALAERGESEEIKLAIKNAGFLCEIGRASCRERVSLWG